jgi:hypothetical protein
MNPNVGLDTFLSLIQQHWLSLFFFSISLTTILVVVGLRWWLRRYWKRLLEEKAEEENELDVLTPIGPADQEALSLIKQLRQEAWDLPEADLQLSIGDLNERAGRIIRKIAAVYHPEAEVPEYEASLAELLQLIRRVSGRLDRLAGVVPFRLLAGRRVSDYQRYYQVYRKINENPILQVLKRNPHLYKVARWAMNLKNLGNPVYWASKELSREGYFYLMRWFYLTFTSQVGREAMRLYSGRRFQTEEDRDGALVCYRLFALAHQWGGPSPAEWATLVDFVTTHPALDSDTKLHVLSRWSKDRLPKDLGEQRFQTKSGIKWYRQGLKRLLDQEPRAIPYKTQLIEQETAASD